MICALQDGRKSCPANKFFTFCSTQPAACQSFAQLWALLNKIRKNRTSEPKPMRWGNNACKLCRIAPVCFIPERAYILSLKHIIEITLLAEEIILFYPVWQGIHGTLMQKKFFHNAFFTRARLAPLKSTGCNRLIVFCFSRPPAAKTERRANTGQNFVLARWRNRRGAPLLFHQLRCIAGIPIADHNLIKAGC